MSFHLQYYVHFWAPSCYFISLAAGDAFFSVTWAGMNCKDFLTKKISASLLGTCQSDSCLSCTSIKVYSGGTIS